MQLYRFFPLLFITITLASCAHKPHNVTEEELHEEKLLITAYNSDYELFAEADPFITGHQSSILAHFTRLEDFKPPEEGSVTVSLRQDNDKTVSVAAERVSDGIYRVSLQPSATGAGSLLFEIRTAEEVSQLIVAGITVYGNEEEGHHAAEEAVPAGGNAVLFTKEQSWKVGFATEEVKAALFGETIRTVAQVEPSQSDEKVVVAKAGGLVLFTGREIVPGTVVQTGQSLFSMVDGGLADNNMDVRYAGAVTEYNRAKAEYDRKKELAKERIVSERELLESEAAYRQAEAVYTNLRKNLSSGGSQVIRSPMTGFVKQLFVRNGEFAEAGQALLVVSQNRDLLIRAELQPRYFHQLGSITTANIKVMHSDQTYSLEDLKGRVISYGKSAGLDNPLIPVVFQVENNEGLLPGSFVEMFIKLQGSNEAITVPDEALIEEMGAYFLYVQVTPELFEKRAVRIGHSDGLRTEIVEGLSAGERVVSRGAIMVKLSQSTGQLDAHGHGH
ncbi:MAG: efflux RND transporter periplasmic adaptor subunit [Proteiniphilum sp.]|nr:efflux RND transporter periplasmic adaptor subunit [Proteiniphilum sp.]